MNVEELHTISQNIIIIIGGFLYYLYKIQEYY